MRFVEIKVAAIFSYSYLGSVCILFWMLSIFKYMLLYADGMARHIGTFQIPLEGSCPLSIAKKMLISSARYVRSLIWRLILSDKWDWYNSSSE